MLGSETKTAKVGTKIHQLDMFPEDESIVDGAWISTYTMYSGGQKYTKDYIDNINGKILQVYFRRDYQRVWWNYTSYDYYYKGQTLTFEELPKEGYTFLGWKSVYSSSGHLYQAGDTCIVGNNELYFTAVYDVREDTPYTVYHVRQDAYGNYNIDGALTEIENLKGGSDSYVTPGVKEYVGFKSPTSHSVKIAPDGSTVVVYKYARKTYYGLIKICIAIIKEKDFQKCIVK